MSRMISFEDFASASEAEISPRLDATEPAQNDALARTAYEQGYSAGFEDAVRKESEARQHIHAEFARNIQDLSFTFHEARAHVLSGLEPLLDAIASTLLPEVEAMAIGPVLHREIGQLAAVAADRPLQLLVAPGQAELLGAVLQDASDQPVRLDEDASLAVGQALIRSGHVERAVDLSIVTEALRRAISELRAEKEDAPSKEQANG